MKRLPFVMLDRAWRRVVLIILGRLKKRDVLWILLREFRLSAKF